MQATGGFPVDLVLFAMGAAFLVLRLRSILGKRTGFEAAPADTARAGTLPAPAADARVEAAALPARPLPEPASAAGQTLAAMRAADRRFDPDSFIAGAEGAFRIIVSAFAAGDRERLRPLLGPATFEAFDQAITARQAAGETQHTEIRDILEAEIRDASLAGHDATITLHIVSRQVNYTTAADGTVLSGTDGVTEIADLWTFARTLGQPALGQPDLAWRLIEAKAA